VLHVCYRFSLLVYCTFWQGELKVITGSSDVSASLNCVIKSCLGNKNYIFPCVRSRNTGCYDRSFLGLAQSIHICCSYTFRYIISSHDSLSIYHLLSFQSIYTLQLKHMVQQPYHYSRRQDLFSYLRRLKQF
jgi:hypothetical protein